MSADTGLTGAPPTALLEGLNPEQREAVEHLGGPILVLAGAGSGKTRVLTTRVAYLIRAHDVDPAAILAVTFTNKAAAEMRLRIKRLLGQDPRGAWIGTFHAIGARFLRRYAPRIGWASNYSIYDADQSLREIKRVMAERNISEQQWNAKAVQAALSSAKNKLLTPASYRDSAHDPFSRVVAQVYEDYALRLKRQNAFDFDDLLVRPIEIFRASRTLRSKYRGRFQFLLVDEYQDTNHAQSELLNLLVGEQRNLMVVGDDDQSIYGWRGADVGNILGFGNAYEEARVIRLERNYRSTSRILDVANLVIAENRRRMGKTLRTVAEPGEPITIVESSDEHDEANWVASEIEGRLARLRDERPRDMALLYRTNAQSRAFEEEFLRRGLPYQIVGGTRFYERREIMDVLAYLRLIANPLDAGAFNRIINYPRRGIGMVSLTRFTEWSGEKQLNLLEAAARADECEDLRASVQGSFTAFANQIRGYGELALDVSAGQIVERLAEESGVFDTLRDEGPDGVDRIENVRELIAAAHAFDEDAALDLEPEDLGADGAGFSPLELFLQHVSLITDVDRHDPDADAVTLMTLHNAKGLEFPVVFVTGLEDGLFPLNRSVDEPADLEEERRLFYVGITRAERKLYMTYARRRRRAGETVPCKASMFLDPLATATGVEQTNTPSARRARATIGLGWRPPSTPRFGTGTRSATREESGVHVDYFDSQDMPRFVKGERVHHPEFGRGVIRGLAGFGRDLRAIIDFEKVGRKKIVVRYANLQKDD